MSEQRHDRLADHLAHIAGARRQRLLARIGEQPAGQRRTAFGRLLRDVDRIAESRVVRRDALAQDLEIAEHDHQQIVEIMRDAAGELADRVHALGARQFGLGALELGDVGANADGAAVRRRPVAVSVPTVAVTDFGCLCYLALVRVVVPEITLLVYDIDQAVIDDRLHDVRTARARNGKVGDDREHLAPSLVAPDQPVVPVENDEGIGHRVDRLVELARQSTLFCTILDHREDGAVRSFPQALEFLFRDNAIAGHELFGTGTILGGCFFQQSKKLPANASVRLSCPAIGVLENRVRG
jgi:hypothetical protein